MALNPRLIAPCQARLSLLQSAGVAFWSPADLGVDALVMPAGGVATTSDLLVAGFNSFMLNIHLAPAVATDFSITVKIGRAHV